MLAMFVDCNWVDTVAVVQYTFAHKQYTEEGNGKRYSQDETSTKAESRETLQIKGFASKVGRRSCFG
jgi:hypothetical protein